MTTPHIPELKAQAKRLRASLALNGQTVSHSAALELIAHQHGFRDWNTAAAQASNIAPPPPYAVNQHVRGRYLDQRFTGTIRAVAKQGDKYRVSFDFDEPVDVVTFDSFSNYRSQVTLLLDDQGLSPQATSNGLPHMSIDL